MNEKWHSSAAACFVGRKPSRLPRWLLPVLILLGGTVPAFATTIRVAVENNQPPLSFSDAQRQPTGFTTELLREMSRVSGVEFVVVPGSWREALERFQSGQVDALANTTITDERRATMDFSIGHAYVHGVIFHRADHPAITSTADFKGKTIATLNSSVSAANARRHHGWGANLRTYDTWQAALDATDRGECDGTLSLTRFGSLDNFKVDEHGMRRSYVDDIIHQYHFAVRKGDAATLEQINAALATVLHNGSFDRIYSKWIGPIEPHPIRLADLRPYYLPGGLILGFVIIFIWWQRHMMRRLARQSEALRQSEERWKFALEGTGAAVWDWDISARRVAFSPAWKEMLGYADEDVGNEPGDWESRVHPEDRARVQAALQAHWDHPSAPYTVEHRLRCKDGGWKWILSRGLVVRRDAAGRPLRMIGTHMDLTARRQAEEDRLVLGKLESTGILAGGIAHDFNNLLTTILLNLDLAQSGLARHDDPAPRLRDIQKATLAARDLTQQLITFAKGGISVRRRVNLAPLLRDSVPLALSGSNAHCEIDLTADLWPAEVDESQIAQVVRNLVLNAHEAMPSGGVITLRAENVTLAAGAVTALPAGDYIRISVTDQGTGIPADVLPAIFDPYFSTKQRGAQKGMGLGLTICHSVAQKHGGTITVETAEGVGTAFHVYLPAVRRSAAS
ncbi:MAG: transporter substrate-binding domain-containing protein [Verrucomicrobia bacterium]|nr:transporter substrate-binding domain-containing protein [Verrucomicrobiota bacterium]